MQRKLKLSALPKNLSRKSWKCQLSQTGTSLGRAQAQGVFLLQLLKDGISEIAEIADIPHE